MPRNLPVIRNLGKTDYEPVWKAMQQFTQQRVPETADELWTTEHFPVYTQGLNGRKEHLLATHNIPVIQVDRGGQVTYHGPGQLIVYCLLDLNRLGIGIRTLVTAIEMSIINLLHDYNVDAYAKKEAPGVYVGAAKIAALGLRIRQGYCYHGLSLNLDMDLKPFAGINPCGFKGLEVTRLADHIPRFSNEQICQQLCSQLITDICYEKHK